MSRYENYEIKNNVFGTLSAPISSLATTIQLGDGQGQRFSENMLATLENIENGKVMKREIVLITAINGDVLTVTRKYAPCPANDDTNTQGQVSFSFSTDDIISAYITKEHFDKIKDSLDDLYNNGDDRLYIKSNGGLNITVTAGNLIVGDTIFHFNGATATVYNNSTNYVMVNDSGSVVIDTQGRDDNLARIGTVITSSGEITSIVMWKIDTIGGKFGGGEGVQAYLCGDTIQKGDTVAVKDYLLDETPTSNFKIGNGYAIKIYGSGISSDNISAFFAKVGTGQDITVRIETDNGGKPSGNLVNVNATGTFSKSDLDSTLTLSKINLAGLVSLTLGTVYWCVFTSTADNTNYSIIGIQDYSITNNLIYVNGDWIENTDSQSCTASTTYTSGINNGSWNNITWTVTMSKTILLTSVTIGGGDTTAEIKHNGTTIYSSSNENIYITLEQGQTYEIKTNGSGTRYYTTANMAGDWFSAISGSTVPVNNRPTFYGIVEGEASKYYGANISSLLFGTLIKKVDTTNIGTFSDIIGIASANGNIGEQIQVVMGGIISNDNRDLIPGKNYYYSGNTFTGITDSSSTKVFLGVAKSNTELKLDIKIYINGSIVEGTCPSPLTGRIFTSNDRTNNNASQTNLGGYVHPVIKGQSVSLSQYFGLVKGR